MVPFEFIRLAWAEVQAMLRTIRQTDMVKLVLIDLDDTLWRGVMAEEWMVELGDYNACIFK